MHWPIIYLIVLAGTTIISALMTRLCTRLAIRWGFLDKPLSEAHKAHREPIPVLGGLAMCVAWNIIIVIGLLALPHITRLLPSDITQYFPGVCTITRRLFIVACGGIAMTALGMCDDKHSMKASRKFLLQFIICAIIAVEIPVSAFHSIPGLNWLVTVFWFMTVINALNFFDNMDGLAGGTSMFAAFFFLLIAAMRGQVFVALLSAATCGAAAGFLTLNLPPAKIFMGDGGSHFLGYCLAAAGVTTTFYQADTSPTTAPILIPVLVLALPLFDAIAVVLIRIKEHRPIYIGDNCHLSHRFVSLGMSRPQAVFVIWMLSMIQGAGAILLIWLPLVGCILVLLQAIAIFLVISIIQFYISEKNHDNRQS
ncbi:MAG: undecaprenyl/decaprenyl-phosphate alpha-N-acetylglucosaminyl 1-phosphate transferase [Victivallales bacterium]|nr:undecaprenyl/decaprenyl-phosphate alpha-N-acetylglucosaminyl 1-phosphate transferase [Victivallales bacterium]